MAFQSNGLNFRELEPEDLPMLRNLRNAECFGWRDNRGVQTIHEQEKWYRSLDKENLAFIAEGIRTITPIADIQKDTEVVVSDLKPAALGMLRISQFDWLHRNVALTGTDVFPDYEGMGYGTRILRAGAEYCIKQLGMHRVTAQALRENVAAQRIILKANFKDEGIWRQAIWRDGKWHDFLQFSILAEEL